MSIVLKDILARILLQGNEDWKARLLTNWPTIMGNLHARVQLLKIQESTLLLGVYEAAWMQELFLLSRVLIRTINEKLGAEHVKMLRFKLVTKKDFKARTIQKKVQQTKITTYHLNSAEKKALEPLYKRADLQEALTAYRIRCQNN